MEKEIIALQLQDVDYPDSLEQTIISINPAHEKLIKPCYDAWSSFWNGGEGFESLEKYLDCAAYVERDRKSSKKTLISFMI